MQWKHDNRVLDVRSRAAVMGVLNVTPDSYFDGGKYNQVETALKHAEEMLRDGADIIDIGGESTGPGSPDVSEQEEIARVVPIVEVVRQKFPHACISVDTWKASVAKAALEKGADMINDVTAGRGDPQMFAVVAGAGCPITLMHAKDATPRTTKADTQYDDVVGHVRTFLEERMDAAKKAGIQSSNIILDPGLGHFVSANPQYSWELLYNLKELTSLGPILVSPSRKSFLAGPQNLPPQDRLEATLAATGIALSNGARFIRTHDVRATVRVRDAIQ